jgi:arylformamidase
MSAHSGTHIDFPAHFILDGKSQDQCDISDFIVAAQVVEIEDTETIRPGEFQHLDIKPNEALLFKTENSRRGLCKSGRFSDLYVHLSPEAAEFCVDKRVSLIGIDYLTIEKHGDETFPAHRKVLGNNILILEGIDLLNVSPGTYSLICLPLKIKGGEASPVRAVLLR